jgi:DNA-binding CsgD family transcriptional regulator
MSEQIPQTVAMSAEAGHALDRFLLRESVRAAAFFLSVSVFLCSVLSQWLFPSYFERGEAFIIALVTLWWIWLFRGSPLALFAGIKDRRADVVGIVEGACYVDSRRGFGLIAPLKTDIIVGGMRFRSADVVSVDKHLGKRVRVQFGLRSKAYLTMTESSPHEPEDQLLGESDLERLRLIERGLSDKEIARELELSPSTVRSYNSTLFRRLGVNSRRDAIAEAKRRRLI